MSDYQQRSPKKSPNDLYSNLKHELKHETSVLISDKEPVNRSGYDEDRYSDTKQLSRVNTAYSSTQKRQYPAKVNGVIKLCETDKQEGGSEYRNMITAEKEIYDLLKQTGPERQIKAPREHRLESQANQNVNIRQQSYYMGQSPSQKRLNDSKYGLRGENNQRSAQRVENMIGEDFSMEDLEFLRGLSKDQLIIRLIKALRLYGSEKKKRMWIENQLRRILGAQGLPESSQGQFGERQEIYSPIKKRVTSKEQKDNDISIYGGISEYNNSPRPVQSPNRSLNEISPVTLNSENKKYSRETQYKPLKSATRNQSQGDSPAFGKYDRGDKKVAERNPEQQRQYEKRNLNNHFNQSQEKSMNRDYNYVSEKKIADAPQNSSSKAEPIRKLKRLHTIGGDHPGMLDLWEQGEAIRKETVTLVSMKKESMGISKQENKSKKQYQRPVYNERIEGSDLNDDLDDFSVDHRRQYGRKNQEIIRATYN